MLRVDHNIAEVRKGLSDMARSQLPFATAEAINTTLGDIQKNETRRLPRALDRPTSFTLKAFAILRASKRRAVGAVFAKDAQADYLKFAEEPQTRTPDGESLVVPVAQKRNKYGNMARGALDRAQAGGKAFASRRGGHLPPGIFQRVGGKRSRRLKMLAAFEPVARYTVKRLRFKVGAQKTADAQFPRRFGEMLERAIRTARK